MPAPTTPRYTPKIFTFIICLLLAMAFAPGAAFSQPYGDVWLVPATDEGYEESCLFDDDEGTALCKVAVVLPVLAGDVAGVEFVRVADPALGGLPWSYLAEFSDFTVLGNTQVAEGATIVLEHCMSTPVQVMTIWYACPGRSNCGELRMAGVAHIHDCAGGYREGGYGRLTVNGLYDVPPGGIDPDCYCGTVDLQTETWGAIKALYRVPR